MFTKQVPLNVAAIPLPDGSLLRFVWERSLAIIAVPRRLVSMLVFCVSEYGVCSGRPGTKL